MLTGVRRTGLRYWLPFLWVALLFIADFKFETRSVIAAVAGVASRQNLVEFGTFGVAGLFSLAYLLRNPGRVTGGTGLNILLSFATLAIASTLWSTIPLFTFVRGLEVLFLALFARASAKIWISQRRDRERDWQRIWLAFIAMVCLLGLSGFVIPNLQSGRFAWQGMHTTQVASYIAIAMIGTTSLLMQARESLSRRTRGFLVAAWLLFAVMLLLTLTRGSIAAGLIALLALCSLHLRKAGARRRAMVLVLGAGVAIALWSFAPDITTFVLRDQTPEEFATLSGRVALWGYATDLFLKSPFFGHGYGSARILLTEAFPWGGTGHNLWVESGIGLGITGALLTTFLLAWTLLRSRELLRTGFISSLGSAGIGLALFMVVESVSSVTIAIPGVEMVVCALLLAALTTEPRFEYLNTSAKTEHAVGEPA